jgi:hypothetical protein
MKPRAEFGLDALLGRWPAQEPQGKGGASWDDRAEAIVSAALALKDQGSSSVTETLLAAPSLEPEPGEENASSFQFESAPERPQSNPGDIASKPQPGRGSQPYQGKKPSLKELAARASQAGAARGSIPPISAAPPSRSAPRAPCKA